MSEITVTQEDRIAWADYEGFEGAFRDRVLSGSEDRRDGLLRFARHRHEARKAALDDFIAVILRDDEEWSRLYDMLICNEFEAWIRDAVGE